MKAIRSKTAARQFQRLARAEAEPIEIAFYLQDWDDAYNVGGIFRVADSVGAVELFASGKTPDLASPMVAVTSLGHHRRLPFHSYDRHDDALAQIEAAGYALIGVEIAAEAKPYFEFDYPKRVCFALGNEEKGLYSATLRKCQACVFIPMFGKGRSMNVHVSAAVVAFRARCAAST